jgi:hypothetical protein
LKKRLLILISSAFFVNVLLVGVGTYSLLTATATNDGNQFTGGFRAETLNIGSATGASASPRMLMASSAPQPVNLTMFYDHTIAGQNPYDVYTGSTSSGEIPGGWAPGDLVQRTWNIQNDGDAVKITEILSPKDKFQLTDKSGNTIPSTSPIYEDFINHMKVSVNDPQCTVNPVYRGTFKDLLQGPQWLDTVICISESTTAAVDFVVSMDLNAGDNLQGVKGVIDFQLGAEQVDNNCFDPPFSNNDYSMKQGSTTPIKFECYDSNGNEIKESQNVKLVITGENLGQGRTYTLSDGTISFNGGHYQVDVDAGDQFIDGVTDTATVYNGSEICGQKTFITEPGNRSYS